jgi:hypothetical protein
MDIFCLISRGHNILTPAILRVFANVSCGFGIPSVKVSTHHAAVSFTLARLCRALENMDTPTFDVLDGWGRLEKNIDR